MQLFTPSRRVTRAVLIVRRPSHSLSALPPSSKTVHLVTYWVTVSCGFLLMRTFCASSSVRPYIFQMATSPSARLSSSLDWPRRRFLGFSPICGCTGCSRWGGSNTKRRCVRSMTWAFEFVLAWTLRITISSSVPLATIQ